VGKAGVPVEKGDVICRVVEGDLLQGVAALLPLVEIEEWSAQDYRALFARLLDLHQLPRVFVRQGAEEDVIDYGEHRGGCAETEGKCCD
jgi:hypothetical protein